MSTITKVLKECPNAAAERKRFKTKAERAAYESGRLAGACAVIQPMYSAGFKDAKELAEKDKAAKEALKCKGGPQILGGNYVLHSSFMD